MSAEGRRILIVDDERDLAEGLAEMLAFLGYSVEIAGDEEGCARSRPRPGLRYRLRRFPHAHDARQRPVLRDQAAHADGARGDDEGFREPILDRALQAGAEGPLLKPFSIKDMLQTIETAP